MTSTTNSMNRGAASMRKRVGPALLVITLLGSLLGVGPVTLLAAAAAKAAVLPDPGTPGPFAVTTTFYSDGDTAFTPPGFPGPVEVKAEVYYPTGLTGGPFPLVVFLHGRHATCYVGASAFLEWPCSTGHSEIPSYKGYSYVGTLLASHGYVVVSIGANGINARDNGTADLGMDARARLMQLHLDKWKTFTTAGGAPFGTQFVGKVDMQKVGTMGHSRGGEGVVRHFIRNQSLGSPYGIKAVLPLAPVDFQRPVINNVPLEVVLPYCDGDVSDLQGIHYYDDARYNVTGDNSSKTSVVVMGANHNFFNSIWTPGGFPAGTADDWTAYVGGGSSDPNCGTVAGNKRLTAAQQRGSLTPYLMAFFRVNLGGETQFLPFLTGDAPPPASAMTTNLLVSYHAPDQAAVRRDVDRFLVAADLTTDRLGGRVTMKNMSPFDLCGGEAPEPQQCLTVSTSQQPHTTPSALSSKLGLSQLRTGWSAPNGQITFMIPAGTNRNESGFGFLSFRIGVNFQDVRNPRGVAQQAKVRLKSGTVTASVMVSVFSHALLYPPGTVSPVPKLILYTVRIPLTAFTGLSLTNISQIQIQLNATSSGAVMITDLAFAD